MPKTMSFLSLIGSLTNDLLSLIIFALLDLVDLVLCFSYKVADFIIESHWKPCYCSPSKEALAINGGDGILLSERGDSKILRLSSTSLHLDEISDTLYARVSYVSNLASIAKLRVDPTVRNGGKGRSTFAVNSTIIELLQEKLGGRRFSHVPRWSDCDCHTCTTWSSSPKDSLFVREQSPSGKHEEDVLFIHGFISSSLFWTETLFPNFSTRVKSSYRLLAVDILGFGRSPKPSDSLYTLREHLDMIEKSVVEPYNLKSFHVVAHSLGCILALALAAKRPGSVKSLTLLSPPYFPIPKGEEATQYVLRRIAPRRVWPLIAFGASMACWYEHISRTVCLLICKNHRLWELVTKFVTRNRMRTFMCEGFFCHTHNAAWHTLHNVICGTGSKLDGYLDSVQSHLNCHVALFHGEDDEVVPAECSFNVQSRIPRATVNVIEKKDHITIVVGRQEAFARELEQVWTR